MSIIVEDIILRCLEPKDVKCLYEYRNDCEVTQYLGGFSSGYSEKDLQEWIEFHRNRNDEIIWAIAEMDGDVCIGHVGFYNIDHRIRSAEIAIMIGEKSFWNKGIGKRVVSTVVEYGFKQLNLHRMYLSSLKNNERAINLYKKLGFKCEGTIRDGQYRDGQYMDIVMMGILENELQSK